MTSKFAGSSGATVARILCSGRWSNAFGGLTHRRTVQELSRKPDRLLRDVGLTREDIRRAVREGR